jgi:cytochrome c551/c552
MKPNPTMIGILVLILAACSHKEESAPAAVTESRQTPAEQPANTTSAVQQSPEMNEHAGTGMESQADSAAQLQQPTVAEIKDSTAETGLLSKTAALELANKSGCLACHSVEKKVVGPAWQDVGARYKGDPGVKARLIDKVKKGGKGNWTEVTGGVPMPPYSPRVSDDAIEKLVTFVLSLP